MPDYNMLPMLIEKLYHQTIEIEEYKSNGWFLRHYGIYRPGDMQLDTFLSLYQTILNDYPRTGLRILNGDNYCKITNEDLSNVDRKNLQILIDFSDFMNMQRTLKILK